MSYAQAAAMVRKTFKITPSENATDEEQIQAIISAACRCHWRTCAYFDRDEFAVRLASVKALFAHVMGLRQQ